MVEENYLLISDDGPGFHTVEGEGELIGTPSVFMRLFGCNLTCKGWASEDSKWGCDSYLSWTKRNKYSFEQMFSFYEENNLVNYLSRGDIWKITGGEPMLRQKPLLAFVRAFVEKYQFLPRIDFETNGTIQPADEWITEFKATFTVSPKLSNNGDPVEKRYVPSVLKWHAEHNSCFKFVMQFGYDPAHEENLLRELISSYIRNPEVGIPSSRVWIMVCAGSRKEHIDNAEAVVEFCKKNGYKFSPRLQLVVWDKALKV